MSKPLIIVGIVIALPLMAIVGLLVVLDNPELFRDRISQSFESQTGLGLKVNGELSWQFFPPIAIDINQIDITSPGSDLPLASLNNANIDLNLMPLIFGGKLEINGIRIDGLTVNAIVNEQGVGNWEVTVPTSNDPSRDSSASGSTPAAEADEGSDENDSSLELAMQFFSLTNTQINYQDLSGPLSEQGDYQLNINELSTGSLSIGQLTNLLVDLSFADKTNQTTGSMKINGAFSINKGLNNFTLDEFKIRAKIKTPDQPELSPVITLNGKIDTDKGSAEFSDSSLSLSTLSILFSLNANNIFDVPGFRGNIRIPEFNAKSFLADMGQPLATNKPEALTRVSISADIAGTPARVVLNNFTTKLDASTIKGNITATLEPNMQLTFELEMDSLNASDYMAPEVIAIAPADNQTAAVTTANNPTEAVTTAVVAPATIEDSEVIPVELLAETDINGSFSLARLDYDDYQLQNMKFAVNNEKQKLKVNFGAELYEGRLDFRLDMDNILVNSDPRGSTTFSMNGVNLSQLAESESITGQITLDSKMRFSGNMLGEVLETLDGWSRFTVSDGTLDVTPLKKVAVIIESIQGKPSSVSQWPDMMPFKQLVGEHNINDGFAQDQQFSFVSEMMDVEGSGGMDYFANSINYDISASLKENAGSKYAINPRLASIKWPLHCEGSLDASTADLCAPDRDAITSLAKNIATEELKAQGTEKLLEKVPEEFKDTAKKLLKSLFN